MDIGKIIAYNLKRLREERNLSQGQLAERAGVSKVIVSQIERGDANPTINTIWKLTGALGLPYTSLLEAEPSKAVYVKKSNVFEMIEGKYHIFNYYSKNRERNFELYQIELDTGCHHRSIGHSTNSFEYVIMTDGEMVLGVRDREYILEQDDALCFDASVPHYYVNNSTEKVKAVLLIQYL